MLHLLPLLGNVFPACVPSSLPWMALLVNSLILIPPLFTLLIIISIDLGYC